MTCPLDLLRYDGPPCECNLCRFSRHITEVKERGDVEEMRGLISELAEQLWNTGEELEMYRHAEAS